MSAWVESRARLIREAKHKDCVPMAVASCMSVLYDKNVTLAQVREISRSIDQSQGLSSTATMVALDKLGAKVDLWLSQDLIRTEIFDDEKKLQAKQDLDPFWADFIKQLVPDDDELWRGNYIREQKLPYQYAKPSMGNYYSVLLEHIKAGGCILLRVEMSLLKKSMLLESKHEFLSAMHSLVWHGVEGETALTAEPPPLDRVPIKHLLQSAISPYFNADAILISPRKQGFVSGVCDKGHVQD